MKITIIEPKSYCAGVQNAINIALKARQDYPDKKIIILGKLVHNQIVTNLLANKGIETVYQTGLSKEQLLKYVPDKSVLIFTAHGHENKLDEIVSKRDLIVLDTTCPKVKHNLELIKSEIANGHDVIYIGNKEHPETTAAISISNKVILYDVKMGFENKNINDDAPFVVNQTTLNILEIEKIFDNIRKIKPNARIQEEICNTTRLRQEAVISLKDDIDLIIIVGDTLSSNSKRLYEIAAQSHPNVTSIMISNIDELDINLIKNKKHIAIASGASTPIEAINDVVNELKKY